MTLADRLLEELRNDLELTLAILDSGVVINGVLYIGTPQSLQVIMAGKYAAPSASESPAGDSPILPTDPPAQS